MYLILFIRVDDNVIDQEVNIVDKL